ncbi:hypothetical protein ACLM5J_09665 [Nocardioides sp. Bht2]|uniref:hypothetical protein n=1 Tax=Nocardioides sp. Bht2 TaxID=3392297 RepID=UPI0039B6A216
MTMTHSHHAGARRQVDAASLALLIVGLVFAVLTGWLSVRGDVNPLVIIPSLVAIAMGASHLTKWVAPRD